MDKSGFEIERRYLIRYPDVGMLEAGAQGSRIAQTYLTGGEGGSERVRERSGAEGTVYTHTVKRRISDMRRREDEREISEEEYRELLGRADPDRRRIEKTRYCLPYKGKVFEIDLFPFWNDRALLEIELGDEGESFELPPCVSVIRELTGDKRYTNASIAKRVPWEDLD